MKIISVFNQKGGVGKTTTAINLAAGLAREGKNILLIDMDPQANTSSGLGLEEEGEGASLYDLLTDNIDLDKAIQTSSIEGVKIIPADSNLAGLEIEAVNIEDREGLLKAKLEGIGSYDYVLIDCPPSLSILTINALTASDSVLIPIQAEYYSLEGLGSLMKTLDLVKRSLNPDLVIEGIVVTMYDARNNLSREVLEEVRSYFKDLVYETMIPRNVRLAEAPSHGLDIFTYDKASKGAWAYQDLAQELIRRSDKD